MIAYPLVGAVELDPSLPLAQALAGEDGMPGAVMDRVLVDRLGLALAIASRWARKAFVWVPCWSREPDSATGGFGLGPRTIVLTTGLANSGLSGPGSLFEIAIPADVARLAPT